MTTALVILVVVVMVSTTAWSLLQRDGAFGADGSEHLAAETTLYDNKRSLREDPVPEAPKPAYENAKRKMQRKQWPKEKTNMLIARSSSTRIDPAERYRALADLATLDAVGLRILPADDVEEIPMTLADVGKQQILLPFNSR